jgi:hypothetical protein
MRAIRQSLSAAFISLFIAGPVSASPVIISFEEIGSIGGGSGTVVFPSIINGVDIGAIGVFDTVKANLGSMSNSSPNAGLLERAVTYRIQMANATLFRFQSADLSRSHNEASFFRVEGLRGVDVLFSAEVSATNNFPFPATFVANWDGIDALQLLWSGPGAPTGIAAIDNFIFEPSPVPLPGTIGLLAVGIALVSREFKTTTRLYSNGQRPRL